MIAVCAYQRFDGGTHLLSGLAYCADSSSPMTYVKESETRTYMVCQGYRKGGRLRLCGSHRVREDVVISLICENLKSLARNLIDEADIDEAIKSGKGYQQLERQLDSLRHELDTNKKVALSLYKDKAQGIIGESEYLEMAESLRSDRRRLEGYIEECENQLYCGAAETEIRKHLKKFWNLKKSTGQCWFHWWKGLSFTRTKR